MRTSRSIDICNVRTNRNQGNKINNCCSFRNPKYVKTYVTPPGWNYSGMSLSKAPFHSGKFPRQDISVKQMTQLKDQLLWLGKQACLGRKESFPMDCGAFQFWGIPTCHHYLLPPRVSLLHKVRHFAEAAGGRMEVWPWHGHGAQHLLQNYDSSRIHIFVG